MNKKLLKLAKLVMKFAEIETDKGILTVGDALAVGVEVYTESEGEFVPAEDGAYETEESIITIQDGKVVSVEEKVISEELEVEEPAKEEPAEEEPEVDPEKAQLEERIAELEGLLAERDATIAELEARLKEAEDKAQQPVAEPVNMSACVRDMSKKDNGVLKYFA